MPTNAETAAPVLINASLAFPGASSTPVWPRSCFEADFGRSCARGGSPTVFFFVVAGILFSLGCCCCCCSRCRRGVTKSTAHLHTAPAGCVFAFKLRTQAPVRIGNVLACLSKPIFLALFGSLIFSFATTCDVVLFTRICADVAVEKRKPFAVFSVQ